MYCTSNWLFEYLKKNQWTNLKNESNYADTNLYFLSSSIPNVLRLFFLESFWGKSAEWWEARRGREDTLSLNSFRMSHRTSAQFCIDGRDLRTGARHWNASLRTFCTALFEAELLLSLGSIAITSSPCFNNCIACIFTCKLC